MIENVIIVAVVALGTIITRFIPFIIFPENKSTPAFVVFLGGVLPYVVVGMIVVYCFKDIVVIEQPYAIPELISIVVIVLLHLWKKNTLLSILVGTAIYMVLVQFVFK